MMPTFAQPDFLWMLPALVLLFLLRLRSHRLNGKGTPGLVADRLRSELVIGATPWLRWLGFLLQTLALALVIIALARPQWGYEEVATESAGRNVIIAVDTSRSMLANDLLPDRLTRAKLTAQDLVDSLPNDRIGLIAFAGHSFLQAPLTMDHMAIVETLGQLDTEIIPRGGTNINSAVAMAIETFQKTDSKDNALILFSDGEDLEGGEALAKIGEDAETLGLIIVAIGVGTEAGSIIPDPDASTPGAFVKDDGGKIVRTRLDPAALRQLSSRTSRGLYLNLGATNSITEVVGRALQQIQATQHEDAIRKRPIERFVWALSLALLFMVLGFLLPVSLRRKKRGPSPALPPRTAKKALAVVLPALLITRPCMAETEATATETSGLPALEAYQNENYKAAVNRYQQEIEAAKSAKERSWLEFGLGSAAYRTGDFELAERSFGKVLERQQGKGLNADAHYNLGNTLFRHGQALLKPGSDSPSGANTPAPAADLEGTARQWKAAIEHYQATLEVEPGHKLASENLKIVGQHLEQLRKQQQQQQDQQKKDEQQKKKDKEEDKDKEQNQDQDKKKGQNQDDKGESKDQQQQPDGSKGKQPPPDDKKNQDGKDGDDKDKQQPPSSDPQNPGDQKDKPGDQSDKPDKQDPAKGSPGKDPKKESKGKPGDQQQEPQPQGKPEPPQQQPEGNLKAEPNQQQPAQQGESQKDQQPNSETGFSPLEARRLLQSLSDEDLNVKPLVRSVPAQPYKNW